MALNLDSNQIFEITRYHNISNKNQHFYAVKETIDNPKPLKTILRVNKTAFTECFPYLRQAQKS